MTKVALLTNFVPPYRVPVYADLAQVFDLSLVVDGASEANRDWAPIDGLPFEVLTTAGATVRRTRKHPDGYRDRRNVQLPFTVSLLLRRIAPDVIVTGELGARTAQAIAYGKATRTPVIVWLTLSEDTERGLSPAKVALRRRLVAHAAAIIVNGPSGVRYVTRTLGVELDDVHDVPNAAPITPIPRNAADSGPLRLLHVGQLIERKGIIEGLDVCTLAARESGRELHVELAGTGPLSEEIERREWGPNMTVELLGHVPPAELPGRYASAHALLMPTLGDAWGLVINEALTCGLPVIASTRAQATEVLVEDGKNGWVFDPASRDSTLTVLRRVMSARPAELAVMSDAAAASMHGRGPQAMAAGMADVIRQAAP